MVEFEDHPSPIFQWEVKKSFLLFWTKFNAFTGMKGFQNAMKGFQKALKECAEKDLTSSKDVEVKEVSDADKAQDHNIDAMTYI